MLILCETLLLCIVYTLDFALWFVCCGLSVCLLKGEWPNCKRTFVFRFSYLFNFKVNIWFKPLNEKTTTRNTWVTHLSLQLDWWAGCLTSVIGRSTRWAGRISALLRVCGNSLIATDYWTFWKKARAATTFNIWTFSAVSGVVLLWTLDLRRNCLRQQHICVK